MRSTVLKRFGYLLCSAPFLILAGVGVCRAGDVVVRLSAQPEEPWLGEKVVLMLDVLTADGWAQVVKLQDQEIDGGYVKRYETQGTRLQEGGYSGQRSEYLFFPQRSGELVIEPMAIDVELKSWGAQAGTDIVRQETPRLVLQVRRPPGVEATAMVISTPDFSAAQKWQPQAAELAVGDAVVRTVTRQGRDISAMVIPPLAPESLPGVGVYPSSPEVDDVYNRGELTGRRVDTITYVMERPGDYRTAELAVSWWNTQTRQLERETLAGLDVHVRAAQPADESTPAAANESARIRKMTPVNAAAAVLLLLLCGLLLKKSAGRWYRGWKKRQQASEKNHFKTVTRAARANDRKALLKAAMAWLDSITDKGTVPRLDQFLSRYGKPGDVDTLALFCSRLEAPQQGSDLADFYTALGMARGQWLTSRRRRRQAERLLPEIGID
ncbi:MAG: hypothetical protein LJE64_10800 [Desulfofustis sp.]|jgi:hypothetical protein|nr:hypothetical protein [Desulfofustis sp.]